MIIVTGATGKLGREIVERLLQRVPAGEIGVSVRDPEKARAFADRDVRVRRGDFSEPDSLQHAFELAKHLAHAFDELHALSSSRLAREPKRAPVRSNRPAKSKS